MIKQHISGVLRKRLIIDPSNVPAVGLGGCRPARPSSCGHQTKTTSTSSHLEAASKSAGLSLTRRSPHRIQTTPSDDLRLFLGGGPESLVYFATSSLFGLLVWVGIVPPKWAN